MSAADGGMVGWDVGLAASANSAEMVGLGLKYRLNGATMAQTARAPVIARAAFLRQLRRWRSLYSWEEGGGGGVSKGKGYTGATSTVSIVAASS